MLHMLPDGSRARKKYSREASKHGAPMFMFCQLDVGTMVTAYPAYFHASLQKMIFNKARCKLGHTDFT